MNPRLPWHVSLLPSLLLALLLLVSLAGGARAQGTTPDKPAPVAPEMDGAAIMAEHLRRHEQFPYVYEQQTMVLVDAAGKRV